MWAGNEKLRLVTFLQKCDEKCSLKVAKVSTTIGRVAKNGFGNILSRTKSDICTLGNTAFEWLKIYFAKATLHTYKLPLWTFANFLKPSENYNFGQNWFIRSNREFGKKKVLVSGKMLAYCQNCGICLKKRVNLSKLWIILQKILHSTVIFREHPPIFRDHLWFALVNGGGVS